MVEAAAYIAPALISGAFSLLGGAADRSAENEKERKEQERQWEANKHFNEYAEKEDKFNRKLWEYDKEKLQDNYQFLLEEAAIKRGNAQANAQYADTVNAQKWSYDLMIRNSEQIALNQQYAKSNELYTQQLDINAQTAYQATAKEYNRFREAEVENTFKQTYLELETLLKDETIKAKGRQGKSVLKSQQAVMAQRGRSAAVLIESLTSAGRDLHQTLTDIAMDQNNADLQAFAQKMLKPGTIPIRPIPIRTPIPVIQDPRKPTKYDYGPKPLKTFKKDEGPSRKEKQRKAREAAKDAAFFGLGALF